MKAFHDTASTKSSSNTIGVLTDTEVLLVDVIQGKRALRSNLLPFDTGELSGLINYLWQMGLNSVWVMPATTLSRSITCSCFELINNSWLAVVHAHSSMPDKPLSAQLWPKGSGQWEARRLAFIFPEHAGWGWELPDARSLLATVTYLDHTLAKPLFDSPELVAHQLLNQLTLDQPTSWLRSSPIDLRTLAGSDGSTISMIEGAQDLFWMRPLTLAEQRQRYLHKYNHISPCLEACTSVKLGAGSPEFSATGRAYDGIRPGIWRVHAEHAGSIFDGKRLPHCLDGEWISTPQVKCCQDIGYRMYVQEGYYWSLSHEFLKHWGIALWQAAERLHTQSYRHAIGRANASHTIEQLALLGVAIFAKEADDGGWSRPDWQVQIAGRSRSILFAHFANLARKGSMPVLVARNSLWFISDDPNPLTAVPAFMAARRWKGYFIGYAFPLTLTSEVKAIFRAAEKPDQAAMALDRLACATFK